MSPDTKAVDCPSGGPVCQPGTGREIVISPSVADSSARHLTTSMNGSDR
jgi:hypothetical protein